MQESKRLMRMSLLMSAVFSSTPSTPSRWLILLLIRLAIGIPFLLSPSVLAQLTAMVFSWRRFRRMRVNGSAMR